MESGEVRHLLERTVFYLDSIIARKVYKLEEARAISEQNEILAAQRAVERTDTSPPSTSEIRLKIYYKFLQMLNESIPPQIYLLLGHYQLLLNFYDDALSAYNKYESLTDGKGRRDVSFLYGMAMCCFHFGAFDK